MNSSSQLSASDQCAYSLTSLSRMNFTPGTGYAKTGAAHNSSFSVWTAISCDIPFDTPLILWWAHTSLQPHQQNYAQIDCNICIVWKHRIIHEDSGERGQSFSARILFSSVDMSSAVTRCLIYFTGFWKNAHFFTLKLSPAIDIRCKASARFLRCSLKIRPITLTSSRYTRQIFQCNFFSTHSRSRSNVAGALQSPNAIT